MPNKRVATLKDVAERVGVHITTVSTVLNSTRSSTRVSKETRARVEQAASELNYRPNAVARGLTRGRMNTLGVLFMFKEIEQDVLTNYYASGILQGIVGSASAASFNVTLFTQPSTFVHDNRTDGVVVIAPPIGSPMMADLAAEGMPLITIASRSEEHGIAAVDVDNELGARLAVEHLLKLGHRRIAHLMGYDDQLDAAIRRDTYCATLKTAGITPTSGFILPTRFSNQWAYDATCRLLALPEPPTAIFASNDAIAAAAIQAACDQGVSVPAQLSVVGFDDMPAAAIMTPSLTTVRQPLTELGKLAGTLLIARITGEEVAAKTHLLAPELVVRQSTGPVP